MPVKIFARRDAEQRPIPPDHSFEVRGCLEFIRQMWRPYHRRQELYAVAANLHLPSADLVVITPYGLGVVEFKHYPGRITQVGTTWFADGHRIVAGATQADGTAKYDNPHGQVQNYANQLRDKLIHPVRRPEWLPGVPRTWADIRVQTAVCFTHPFADVGELETSLLHERRGCLPWEDFSVLTLPKAASWVAELQFGLTKGRAEEYAPELMTPTHIVNVTRHLLKCVEWTEAPDLMPTGEPYAYLTAINADGMPGYSYGLRDDENLIGRDPKQCIVDIPEELRSTVSRRHARLIRSIEGVFLEDLGSRNGTYLNGQRVIRPVLLQAGQVVTLGNPEFSGQCYQLVFTHDVSDPAVTTSTSRRNS